ncbi:hemerythrin domain-containing protein [Flavihumibacter petaseus]|uniref:Hemerythrin-like domain-containing protein n=1 Tax=Flavihumibacter petaseus NBRC 106054 TaxID=1220578 RepID=A0A0E9MVY6_9BACT|nr:hemerythrin domain-containing protein [Flavihumibacter petaseus]GAO41882.1 hypothetical protein FPE01S_01_08970 [Flavihumibacter petaseus NBRC 106054]
MKRFNAFGLIHKALRAMLFDVDLELQQADWNKPEDVRQLISKLQQVLNAFEHHAYIEDNYVLPLIAGKDRHLQQELEGEHQQDKILTEALLEHIEAIQKPGNPLEKSIHANAIQYAFHAFVAFNLDHMNKEETTFNRVLWQYYSDEEIMAVNEQISKMIEPASRENGLLWMLRGCNAAEISMLMQKLEQQLPAEAFHQFRKKAVAQVPGKFRYLLQPAEPVHALY